MRFLLKSCCCRALVSFAALAFASVCSGHSAMYPDNFKFDDSNEGRKTQPESTSASHNTKASVADQSCSNGLASDYPCRNIDLLALLSPREMGGGNAQLNDIWGWTDLASGMEVAIVGRRNGTSFVNISNGTEPVLLGFLASHNGGSSSWRDIKVYQDHAFIVADGESNAGHGLQVYDLASLAHATPGATVTETAHFDGFGPAHNIAINEDSGYAYIVGADQCSGGLYMVDISVPEEPDFAGCFSADGYTHDAQCVTYQGPDTRYFGNEICVAYNEDTITIVDVTDKQNPVQVSRTPYAGAQYTHQGWFLSDNHTYIIMNDELDEIETGGNTTTHLYDLSLLDAPHETGRYVGTTKAIDHNLYTRDGLVYQANYRAGLRILDAVDISQGNLQEKAYFDTNPCSDSAQFSGAWSSYAYFASGNVVVSDIATGLFVLRPDGEAIASGANDVAPATSAACAPVGGDSGGSNAGSGPGATGVSSGGSSGGGGGGIQPLVVLLLASLLLTGKCLPRRK